MASPISSNQRFHFEENAERIDANLILNVSPKIKVYLNDSNFRPLIRAQKRGPEYSIRDGTFNIIFSSEDHVESKNTNRHLEWAINIAYQVKSFLIERDLGPLNDARINLIWWPLRCDGFTLAVSPRNIEEMAKLGLYLDMWVSYYGECGRDDDAPLSDDEPPASPSDVLGP